MGERGRAHTDRTAPVPGTSHKIVPPSQAELSAAQHDAVRSPYADVMFSGEQTPAEDVAAVEVHHRG